MIMIIIPKKLWIEWSLIVWKDNDVKWKSRIWTLEWNDNRFKSNNGTFIVKWE